MRMRAMRQLHNPNGGVRPAYIRLRLTRPLCAACAAPLKKCGVILTALPSQEAETRPVAERNLLIYKTNARTEEKAR